MVESAAVPSDGPCGAARAGWLAARLIFSRKDSRRCPGCRPPGACLAATPFGCCSWFLSTSDDTTTQLVFQMQLCQTAQAGTGALQGPRPHLLGPAPGDPSREGLCRARGAELAAARSGTQKLHAVVTSPPGHASRNLVAQHRSCAGCLAHLAVCALHARGRWLHCPLCPRPRRARLPFAAASARRQEAGLCDKHDALHHTAQNGHLGAANASFRA